MIWWMLGVAVALWGLASAYLDRAAIPAYQAKQGWKWLALLGLVGLALLLPKAVQHWQELRDLIQRCR